MRDRTPQPPYDPPPAVRKQRLRCLLSYIVSNVVMGLMVYAVPEKSHGHAHRVDALITMTFFQALTVLLLLTFQGSDPGYISKALAEELIEQAGLLLRACEEGSAPHTGDGSSNNDHAKEEEEEDKKEDGIRLRDTDNGEAKRPEGSRRTVNGVWGEAGSTRAGFCPTCDMHMPLRTVHCHECGRCVALYDHHCYFIGTCIGERNHARFWWFMLVQNAAIFSAIRLVDTGWVPAPDGTDWVLLNTLPLAMSFLLWALELFAGLLLVSHTFFAMGSTTTYECGRGPERVWYLRGSHDCDLPFSQGCVDNLRGFCFSRDGCWSWVLGRPWHPTVWRARSIVRDSDDVFEHPWRNRYWACC